MVYVGDVAGDRRPGVRPDTPLVRPTRLEPAFADPDHVRDLIRRGSPYLTEEKVHKHPGVTHTGGWFRNFWALGGKVVFDGADDVFHNPIYLDAARHLFGAAVVRPVAMMANLNLPMAGLPPHLDLPFFRGAMNREVPAWMLEPMGYSGLFQRWAVPVASAVAWFYDGEGGEFEFWPDGIDAPPRVERPPFRNEALMADNEYTYHRVGPLGRPDRYVAAGSVPYDAELVHDVGGWEVRDGDRVLGRYDEREVRLSVLWKAYCFRTDDEADAFDDRSDDLTPQLVQDIFLDDLRERGVEARPSDELAWKATLLAAYPPRAPGSA